MKKKINIEVTVEWHAYDTKAKNGKVIAQVRKWLRSMMKDNHIPLCIEKDEFGSLWEDSTKALKCKIG